MGSVPVLQFFKSPHYNAHCSTTGHSHVQPCSTSCCIATVLTTLPSNPAVQAAALQHYWSLSLPTLQYKLLHCKSTDPSQVQPCSTSCCITTTLTTLTSNPEVQAVALQHHWTHSRPNLQYKLLHCKNTDHSHVQTCSTSCCIATVLTTLSSKPAVQTAAFQQH